MSSIRRLAPEVRARLERHLREDRLTLSEIIADLQAHFPDEKTPSRSAVWRHKGRFDELLRRTREQQEMAAVLVENLGENPEEKAGALMVQSITTLLTHASLAAQEQEDEIEIEDVRKLASAARDVIQARKVDRQERVAIRQAAREELLEEQRAALAEVAAQPGVSPDTMTEIRRRLGIA